MQDNSNYTSSPTYQKVDYGGSSSSTTSGVPSYTDETTLFEWLLDCCVATFDHDGNDALCCGSQKESDHRSLQNKRRDYVMKETDQNYGQSRLNRVSRRVHVFEDPHHAAEDELVKRSFSLDQTGNNLSASFVDYGSDPGSTIRLGASASSPSGSERYSQSLPSSPVRKENQTTEFPGFKNSTDNADNLVKYLFQTTMKLIWHPSVSQSLSSPTEVNGWLKLGEVLSSTTIQPKMQWCESASTKSCQRQPFRNSPLLETAVRGHIDLLDILEVRPARKNDRDTFPLARRHLSFVITTLTNESHLFESRSTNERDVIIFGLKTIVQKIRTLIDSNEGKAAVKDFFSSKSKYLKPVDYTSRENY